MPNDSQACGKIYQKQVFFSGKYPPNPRSLRTHTHPLDINIVKLEKLKRFYNNITFYLQMTALKIFEVFSNHEDRGKIDILLNSQRLVLWLGQSLA